MVQRRKREFERPEKPRSKPVIEKVREKSASYKRPEMPDVPMKNIIIWMAAVIAVFLFILFVIIPIIQGGGEPDEFVPAEPARIDVLNGTGIGGIAGQMADFVGSFNPEIVAEPDNADRNDYAESIIICITKGLDTRGNTLGQAIADSTGIFNMTFTEDTAAAANVQLILGRDYANFRPFFRK